MQAKANTEEWRDVPGYVGFYQISSHGRLRSLDRIVESGTQKRKLVGRHMATPPQIGGYPRAALWRDGRLVNWLIHRLVLEVFVGPCLEGMECRHLDGDPGNNQLQNLAWGTPVENGADRVRHGTVTLGVKNSQSKLTEQDVLEIYKSTAARPLVAARFGVSRTTIYMIKTGKSWSWLTGHPR